MRYTRFSRKKAPSGLLPPPPSPAPTIRRGIGEFSPTAPFQLEKNLQHAPHLVAAGMPLLLGLRPNCEPVDSPPPMLVLNLMKTVFSNFRICTRFSITGI